MTIKSYLIIGAILAILLTPTTYIFASESEELTEKEKESGFYDEKGYELSQSNRPAINPDFAPDESCLFDVFQLKCIPGSQQDCPEDFGNNEDATCFPLIDDGEWGCPEGYHTVNDDETGQCYPDDEGCQFDDYILVESSDGDGYVCAHLSDECGKDEHREEDYCVDYSNEYPERNACRPEINLVS